MTPDVENYKNILTSSGERQVLPALIGKDRTRLETIFDNVLDGLEAALYARRIELPKRRLKVAVDCGPDHAGALKAARRFIRLMTAGRLRPHDSQGKEWFGPRDMEITFHADAADEDPGDKEQARLAVEKKYNMPWKRKARPAPPPTLPSLLRARAERVVRLYKRALEVQGEASIARHIIYPKPLRAHLSVAVDRGPDYHTAGQAADIVIELLLEGRALPIRERRVYTPPASIEEVREIVHRGLARRDAEEDMAGEESCDGMSEE